MIGGLSWDWVFFNGDFGASVWLHWPFIGQSLPDQATVNNNSVASHLTTAEATEEVTKGADSCSPASLRYFQ